MGGSLFCSESPSFWIRFDNMQCILTQELIKKPDRKTR